MPREGADTTIYYSIYPIIVLMTTIAVKESTAEKLKRLMKTRHTESLDQTINALIEDAERVPRTMFGADKNRRISLTKAEHEDYQE